MTTEHDQPLRRQLSAQSDRLRAEYLRRGFTRDDYQNLVERADRAIEAASVLGIEPGGLAPLRDSRGVLNSVLRLLGDRSAETIAPSNDQVYGAALRVARLSRLTTQFGGAPKAWRDELAALLTELDAQSADAGRRLVLLEFAAICRGAGIRIEPAAGLRAELEIDDWALAAVPTLAEAPGSLASAASRGCAGLVEMKRPGLVVIDAGGAMPEAPSLRRVANDQTAEVEMRRHVDQFIIDNHDAMVGAVDTRFAFAAVVGAVLHSVNVSAGRVNFAACYRVVNLCDADDARAPRLRRFMERFARPVSSQR